MKKSWIKKGGAVLLATAMMTSLFSGMKGTLTTVQAASNTLPESKYWTDVEGLKGFTLDEATDTVGTIIFGQNGSGSAQKWKIAGVDSGIEGDNIVLFAASPLLPVGTKFNSSWDNKTYDADWGCTYASAPAYVYSNHYGGSELRQAINGLKTNLNYFSTAEQNRMNPTTIYTDDTKNRTTYTTSDYLYAGYGTLALTDDKYITVGTNSTDSLNGGIKIDISQWGASDFWLRSPSSPDVNYALVALPRYYIGHNDVNYGDVSVVPAFNLNLSSVIFASAAHAASSSGYKANTDLTPNAYTLRYTSNGSESAVISADGTKVKVTNAAGKYLMVQNGEGVYALQISGADQTVNASSINMGSALENFTDCKVCIESTDADSRITTAKLATLAPTTYAVTVNNGTGDADYEANAQVTITADAAPSGKEFDKWTVVSGGVTLASATSTTTTFTMPTMQWK